MWIFTTSGFVSAVRHRDKAGQMLVRSRKEIDLNEFLAAGGLYTRSAIQRTPEADYLFRGVISDAQFHNCLGGLADEINYPNFKAAVATAYRDPHYSRILADLWHELRDWQQKD